MKDHKISTGTPEEFIEKTIVDIYDQKLMVDNDVYVHLRVKLLRITHEIENSNQPSQSQLSELTEIKRKLDSKDIDYQTVVASLNQARETVRKFLEGRLDEPIVFSKDGYTYTTKIDQNGEVEVDRT